MAMAAGHKLPDRDIANLQKWIDAGAELQEKRMPNIKSRSPLNSLLNK